MVYVTVIANATGVPVYGAVFNAGQESIIQLNPGLNAKMGPFGGGIQISQNQVTQIKDVDRFARIGPGESLYFGLGSKKDRLVTIIAEDGFVICHKYSIPNGFNVIATSAGTTALSHEKENKHFISIDNINHLEKMYQVNKPDAVDAVEAARKAIEALIQEDEGTGEDDQKKESYDGSSNSI